jgi:hypothetical protein
MLRRRLPPSLSAPLSPPLSLLPPKAESRDRRTKIALCHETCDNAAVFPLIMNLITTVLRSYVAALALGPVLGRLLLGR